MNTVRVIISLGVIVFASQMASAQAPLTPQERLYKIVLEDKVEPDEQLRQRIATGCVAVQASLKKEQPLIDSAINKRISAYDALQKEFKAIELRMTRQGADASELDLLIGGLQQKIDAFVQNGKDQKSLIADLLSLPCASNPVEFKAGLDRVRFTNNELIRLASELRKIVYEAKAGTFAPLEKRLTSS